MVEKRKQTIEDLLKALNTTPVGLKELINSKETWSRIGNKDSFDELGLTESELEALIVEFTENNDYNDLN